MLSSLSKSPEKEKAESGPVMCFQTDIRDRDADSRGKEQDNTQPKESVLIWILAK